MTPSTTASTSRYCLICLMRYVSSGRATHTKARTWHTGVLSHTRRVQAWLGGCGWSGVTYAAVVHVYAHRIAQAARRGMLQIYFEKYIVRAGSENKGVAKVLARQSAKITVRCAPPCGARPHV